MFKVDGSSLVIVIPTLNEELHIGRCISSVKQLESPTIIVDAHSNDGTRDIAKDLGATVVTRRWSGHSEQKNWALDEVVGQTKWVLFLDADEFLSNELAEEIREKIMGLDGPNGYYIPRMNIFLGRPLVHAWWYPDHQLRLFKAESGRFENRSVHEHVVVAGRVDALRNPLMHENLKGIDAFIERHQRYARAEALEFLDTNEENTGSFLGNWAQRRRALKFNVWRKLQYRPAIRFLWMYFVRRGFLDGAEGRVYSQLISAYESMIDAYVLEERHKRGFHPKR